MGIETEPEARIRQESEHPNTWVFYNGEIVRYHDVRIGLMTHALHYGTGSFEGIRAYWNPAREQLYLLEPAAHFERMRGSARILRMHLPYSTEELVQVTIELLRRNNFRQDTYVRPVLFKSSEEIGVRLHGLKESFAIYLTPFGKYVEIDKGIRCMVSSWRRIQDQALPPRAKITGSYVNAALSKTEAVEHGFDEAIVLTQEGHVCEGSAENLFMLKDGVFVTPPVADDILEGVTRKLLMQMIRDDLTLPVIEINIDSTE